MEQGYFDIPPNVIERHKELYDIIQEKSKNGMIAAADVAKYYNMRHDIFCRILKNGGLPFAFSDPKALRAKSYIDIYSWYQYASQGGIVSKRLEGLRM